MDLSLRRIFQGAAEPAAVQSSVDAYTSRFDLAPDVARTSHAAQLAKTYYDLATDFYEYGWGESFHFAPRRRGESLNQSIARNELELAGRLEPSPGMKVLDVGCGIGGPMRNIARSFSVSITGITNAPYHVVRGRKHTARAGLAQLCELVEGDFNAMPFEADRFDAAYTIESCCHAGDRRGPFAEVLRVLRPGAPFVGTDWCLTPLFRPGDPEHERIKAGIEKGDGIARLTTQGELDAALRDVGFQVLETRDLTLDPGAEVPWYASLASGVSLRGFRNSRAGSALTHHLVRLLETLGLSPPGTVRMHDTLRLAQTSLVEGGRLQIFTPHHFWLARKPG